MESIIGIIVILGYSIFDGMADASIFRWIRERSNMITKSNIVEMISTFQHGSLWIPFIRTGIFDLAKESADLNTRWHRWQAAQQALVIGAVAFFSHTWQIIPLGAGLFWLVQDGIVNVIGLDRSFFFVGTTAWLDKLFQKLKHPQAGMAAAKIGLIVAGALCFLIKL